MKKIEAKEQVRLGPYRCLQLAVNGIFYRLFRSSVTVAILSLATAFLVHMLAYGVIDYETRRHAHDWIERDRLLGRALMRLSRVDDRAAILANLARDNAAVDEYMRWIGGSRERREEIRGVVLRALDAAEYLERLPPGPRAMLTEDVVPFALFDRLADRKKLALFCARLLSAGVPAPLDGSEFSDTFIPRAWPALNQVVRRIQNGHAEAIAAFDAAYPARGPLELFADRQPDMPGVLREAGFAIAKAKQAELSDFARRRIELDRLRTVVSGPAVQTVLAYRFSLKAGEVSLKDVFEHIDGNREAAASLSELLGTADGTESFSTDDLLSMADYYITFTELSRFASAEPPARLSERLPVSARVGWLLLLALLVCVVGVTNAMLMSVTERFAEIATMKCLGALDGFIMMMFVFEAGIQGLVGGLVGILLGVLLALLRAFAEYGGYIVHASSAVGNMAVMIGLSLAISMLLAVIAAVGPSLAAARLAPMEAMRIE